MEPTTQDFNDFHAGRSAERERPAARGEVRHEVILTAEPDDAFSTHFVRTIDDHGAVVATDLCGSEGLGCVIYGREVEVIREPVPTYDDPTEDHDPDGWHADHEADRYERWLDR